MYACFGLLSATTARHRKIKDFPKPVGRLTNTSLPQKTFHRFPLLGNIVRYFELLHRAPIQAASLAVCSKCKEMYGRMGEY